MKKLLTVVFTMLVAGSLAFAQATGGSTDQAHKGGKTAATEKTAEKGKKGGKKGHKGGKKSKKGSTESTTPPPK